MSQDIQEDRHPHPTCSVVVRAYNEARHIERLLDGIAQQTIRDIEVILVDSGSTDDTVSVARQHQSRVSLKVVYIPPEEFTFGRSLNLGISHTKADLVVIASAHVYPVYPDWLAKLLAPFRQSNTALSYGKQRGDGSTRYSEHRVFARWFPDHSPPSQDHPFCNNANAAIRRELWEERPYNEKLSGLEDLDWANWAYQQGYEISYVPEAEVIHVHNETPQGVYNRYRREAMAFKQLFPDENFSFWDFIRLAASNISSDTWHAIQDRLLLRSLSSIFWFRWMQFRGTYHGYREAGPLTWKLRQTFYYPGGAERKASQNRREVDPIRYND